MKKIQQLREMNKNTEKKTEPVERMEGVGSFSWQLVICLIVKKRLQDFNIGVWDPEMGAQFAPEKRPDFIETGDDDAVKLKLIFHKIGGNFFGHNKMFN